MPRQIVFVHGLFHGFGHLADFRSVAFGEPIVIDLLGFGRHTASQAPDVLDAQVQHVEVELDRLGISRPVLVGHSVGGAVVMLLAARAPDRVEAVVNVEGNFTKADTFWSSKIAAMTPAGVEAMLTGFRDDPGGWLERQKITPSDARLAWTRRMFDAQPAATIHATARAIVAATEPAGYLTTIGRVLGSVPLHLFAGQRSRQAWGVPQHFVDGAASYTVQPGTGHMMPVEEPAMFLDLVDRAVGG